MDPANLSAASGLVGSLIGARLIAEERGTEPRRHGPGAEIVGDGIERSQIGKFARLIPEFSSTPHAIDRGFSFASFGGTFPTSKEVQCPPARQRFRPARTQWRRQRRRRDAPQRQSWGPPEPDSWLNTRVTLRLVPQLAQPPRPSRLPRRSPPERRGPFFTSRPRAEGGLFLASSSEAARSHVRRRSSANIDGATTMSTHAVRAHRSRRKRHKAHDLPRSKPIPSVVLVQRKPVMSRGFALKSRAFAPPMGPCRCLAGQP